MNKKFAINRVIEPKEVLPTSAWQLNNEQEIQPHEMRVAVKTIHLEGTNFHQICLEANDDDVLIEEKIMDIIIRRGKLHNPVTDTGGLAHGFVDEIGSEYEGNLSLAPGDEIICNASLASMPIYINKILSIDRAYHQIEVEGYLIVYGEIPIVPRPKELPIDLLLYVFNESGTMFRVSTDCLGKETFMIAGNNLMMNLIYGYVIRRALGQKVKIICVLDKKSNTIMEGDGIDQLVEKTFQQVHFVDLLRPLEALKEIGGEASFDMVINCAEIPGCETLNILATKKKGTLFFANFVSNFNISLYITESISREIDIRSAEGYLPDYDAFDIRLVKELLPFFEGSVISAVHSKERIPKAIGQLHGHRAMSEDFICESGAMKLVLKEIQNVAKYDCNVLITGDTGVGKEKIANMIAKNSNRHMQPLVKVNCAAIAPNLMESEFFGYEGGSFTGAKEKGKKGYFEEADNGFVFLDEVGELPLDIQAKLLRVVQDGEFFKVGGTKPIKTNVRIISATNKNLEKAVEKKTFRRDLYYRLNVFPLRVPSLAHRIEDIGPLTIYFLKRYGEKFGVKKGIDPEAIQYLEKVPWQGNIRQLENTIQRLLISTPEDTINLLHVTRQFHEDLPDPESLGRVSEEIPVDLKEMVSGLEKQIISLAHKKYASTRKAAKAIGISQTQFIRKKKQFGIGEVERD